MIAIYFCKPLGVDMTPIGNSSPHNFWDTAGDVIQGVGSVIGSIIGGSMNQAAQAGANETNLQISRETNAQNRAIYNDAVYQQKHMWDLQNEYNTPKNQVARLQEAHLNPALAYGDINSVSGASQISLPSPSYSQPTRVEPENGMAQAVQGAFQGAVNAYNQSRLASAAIEKTSAETAGLYIDNEEKQRGLSDRLEYLSKMAKEKGYLGELAKTQLEFELKAFNVRQAMLGADYTMQLKQINNAQEQFNQARLQNDLYKIQVAYAPKLNDAQLKQYYATVNQLKAQVGLINANKMLTDEQRLHEIEKKTSTIIDNGLKGLDFKLKDETKKYVVQQAKNESILTQKDVEDYEPNWWNRIIQGYIPFASGSATAGTKAYLKVK